MGETHSVTFVRQKWTLNDAAAPSWGVCLALPMESLFWGRTNSQHLRCVRMSIPWEFCSNTPTHTCSGWGGWAHPKVCPALGSKAQVLLQCVACPKPALHTQELPSLQVLTHEFLASPLLTAQPPPQTSFPHTSLRYVGGLSSGIYGIDASPKGLTKIWLGHLEWSYQTAETGVTF